MSNNTAGVLAPLLITVVFFVIMYALMIVPDKKRRKKYDQMLNDLKVNDEVMTRGGIIGKVIKIEDDNIILESGPDRVRFKMSKRSISTVNTKEEKEDK